MTAGQSTATQTQIPEASGPDLCDGFLGHPGEQIFDEYIIIKKIDTGGTSTIYLAEHTATGKHYAVKIPEFIESSDKLRKHLFCREIRTWIDLPDHRHLNKCNFCRTHHNRFIIFSEYIDGGNLDSWVANLKIRDLSSILDLAIQIAWGLAAAHEYGIIHQDIKPSNILLTKDGIAKLTDFGLARAFEIFSNIPMIKSKNHKHPSTVSGIMMTPAFASPEQFMSARLDFRTDIWSYGVTVMSMFTGPAFWPYGSLAMDILNMHVRKKRPTEYPPIPTSVFEILQRCFAYDPNDRWQNMDAIAAQFIACYSQLTGMEYFRKKPNLKCRTEDKPTSSQSPTLSNVNSEYWLQKSLGLPGIKTIDIPEFNLSDHRSLQAETLGEIEKFDFAVDLYRQSIIAGNPRLIPELAELLISKSRFHERINDQSGQIDMLRQAVNILEEKRDQGSQDTEMALPSAYFKLALALDYAHRFIEAIAIYEQVETSIDESIYSGNSASEAVLLLGQSFISKGTAKLNFGNYSEAKSDVDRGIEILESFLKQTHDDNICEALLVGYFNRASLSLCMREYRQTITKYQQFIKMVMARDDFQDNEKLLHQLAMAKQNIGLSYFFLDRFEDALIFYRQALKLSHNLVFDLGCSQYFSELILIYSNLGTTLERMKQFNKAVGVYKSALKLIETAVFDDGRNELLDQLGLLYINKGVSQMALGQLEEAESLFDKSIHIWNHLLVVGQGVNVHEYFASAVTKKANIYRMTGRLDSALSEYKLARSTYEQLICNDERRDLTEKLKKVNARIRALITQMKYLRISAVDCSYCRLQP